MNVLANHPKMANTFGLVTVGIFDIPSYPNFVGYSPMKYSRLQDASMVFPMAMFLLFVHVFLVAPLVITGHTTSLTVLTPPESNEMRTSTYTQSHMTHTKLMKQIWAKPSRLA